MQSIYWRSLKLVLTAILSVSLLLTSCQDEGQEEELKQDLSIADAKLILVSAKAESDLITKIEKDDQFYSIHFESGIRVTIQAPLIKKIEVDSTLWLTTFYFTDESSQDVNFVGELRLSSTNISLNPFLTCPLAAIAKIEMPVKGKFKVIVHGRQSNGVTIEKIFNQFSERHELPILGLYENFNNQVEFVFLSNSYQARCSQIIAITTPVIENKPPVDIQITKEPENSKYNGLYFISNLKLGFDQLGEIRWYYSGEGSSFFGKVRNGNFIIATSNNLYFHEVTMTGQLVKKYYVPNALHHEIVELPNGNFLVASHSPPGPPYEDVFVEIDRMTGGVSKSWDFNTILDPLRTTLPSTQAGDWLHINALYYDETDNSIVISGRSQSAVVKIDYSTGAIKWILGNHQYWGPVFQPYLLKPVDASGNELIVDHIDFWPYGQHATQKLPNGNLLLYDNGDYRGFYDNPNVSQNSYTRTVEYKINEQQKTVEMVWQFDHAKSVFTKFTGYTQSLGNTRLAAYMWVSENTPKIVEVNGNNQIIYEATINQGKASYYRTLKVDLYEGI